LPRVGHLLHRWKEWEPEEAVAHVRGRIQEDDRAFAQLVLGVSTKSYSAGLTDRVSRSQWRVPVDSLEELTGLDQREDRAGRILKSIEADLEPDEVACLRLIAERRASRKGQP
jgi:hypothetical protein